MAPSTWDIEASRKKSKSKKGRSKKGTPSNPFPDNLPIIYIGSTLKKPKKEGGGFHMILNPEDAGILAKVAFDFGVSKADAFKSGVRLLSRFFCNDKGSWQVTMRHSVTKEERRFEFKMT